MSKRLLTFTLASLIGCSGANQVSFQGRIRVTSTIEEKDLYLLFEEHQKELDTLLAEQQRKFRSQEGLKGIELLKENEYVLPDNVIDAFKEAWYPGQGFVAEGFYLPASKKKRKEKLEAEVNKLNQSEEEKAIYLHLFTFSNVIIYKMKVFKEDSFKSYISHERTHQYWYTTLTAAEKESLTKAYDDLKQLEMEFGRKDKRIKKPLGEKFDVIEFYPYLIDGVIPSTVIEELQAKHSEAYKIYQKMEKAVKLK